MTCWFSNMRRRSENILEELVEFPWWVSVVVAAIVYCCARWLAPAVLSDRFPGKAIAQSLSASAPLLAILFLIPAPFAAIRTWRRNRALAGTRDGGTVTQMPWDEFENLLAAAFRRIGYEVEERGGGGPDGGVDLVLREPGMTTLVQCKHWKSWKVGVGVVRELYGVMNSEAAERGAIVTSGTFTGDAEAFARGKEIDLVDGAKLRTLLSYARGDEASTKVAMDGISRGASR